ncbi:MAG TPA: hypothetical protein VK699_12560 [Terriglobales bacterium]|jgi:hypothetical protein|nr:hypothetical protein [Terriglobales bacterium]
MHEFYSYVGQLLHHSVVGIPELVSSNWVAVLASVAAFVITFVKNVKGQESYKNARTWREKLNATRKHWLKNAVDGAKVTTWIWIGLFFVSFLRTIDVDHYFKQAAVN